jgi:hypothetical protein
MATLSGAPLTSQESSSKFPANIIGKEGNITFKIKEKLTPAVRGTLFPLERQKSLL